MATMMVYENIDISKAYDARYADDDVHYETFARLAQFFGRDMHPHWHDRYFQLHFLVTGKITLQLDDNYYDLKAPLFVLTPPSVPHAFITENDSDGHVLTVRQEIIWPIIEKLWPGSGEAVTAQSICLSLESMPGTLSAINQFWPVVAQEFARNNKGRQLVLTTLAQTIFTLLLREAQPDNCSASSVRGEMPLFQRFNHLVDQHYRAHLTVPDYAKSLGVSESRLTELCHRFANLPPKRLIFERLFREAKRQLLFSAQSVNQISYALGYKDPAYFSRFFHRMAGCSPSQFRNRE